jgi:hypothetical protein
VTTHSTAGRDHAIKRRRGETFDDWFDRVQAYQLAARPVERVTLWGRIRGRKP